MNIRIRKGMEMEPHWGVGDSSVSLHPVHSMHLYRDPVEVTFPLADFSKSERKTSKVEVPGRISIHRLLKDKEMDVISSYQAIKWSLQIKCLPFTVGF